MSIELVLIPVAIAALAAYQARSEKNEGRVFIQTRLKDPQMLMHACVRAGMLRRDHNFLQQVFNKYQDSAQKPPRISQAHLPAAMAWAAWATCST